MARKTMSVWWVREDDEPEYLAWGETGCESRETWRQAAEKDLTLEVMADFLDQDAENINAHDFVGAHRGLAALLYQEVGRTKATRVLRRLVNYRGLHGMVGVCGRGDPGTASLELGVPLGTGRDEQWSLGPTAGES